MAKEMASLTTRETDSTTGSDAFADTPEILELRRDVRTLCMRFPDPYWRDLDQRRAYPKAFVQALTDAGWLAALIPARFGGLGYGLREAATILQEINQSGAYAGPAHAQMYVMGTLLRHGSEDQKARYLPQIASGVIRLQAFAVTEPTAGTDTTRIETAAVRDGEDYVITGRKMYISRVQHSDLMVLLARTSPRDDSHPTAGLSLFLIDLRQASDRIRLRPLRMMMNNETNEVTIDALRVPGSSLIGNEGMGFRYILDGWNAERILIAAECVGDGRWFIERASGYAKTREVFGRPIGANQGIQFPLAMAWAQVEAADLMARRAAARFDAGVPCGAEANTAKLLASEASWAAANAAVDTLGGHGFNAEHDVERKFRETRLYRVAPVSNNLVLSYLAQHVLGLPRSY
ncbi:MAG: acyl-CoA dehydrogenase-like protein [Thermomicrobiales bacterium]|jgi:acyl-CoA dehydrogenase|nr:acyl-CoA dehydrogenase-like protein [Thermomicrobiales bacterium]